jgi:endonuclease-3
MTRTEAKRAKVLAILRRLERAHGRRTWRSSGPCLDELVYAMLSQNTNLANADSGYRQLRRRFPTWTQVMNADVRDVQRQIAVCGLARMRARRLQAILRTIKQQHGKLDLQFLAEMQPTDGYAYLTTFQGIGPKTAAYTLLFSLGVPMFPVENGILRMTRRLRLVRQKARDEEASRTIESLSRPNHRYALHVLMFAHAKKMCRPRNPTCGDCSLADLCPHGQRRRCHAPPQDPLPQRRARPIILSRFMSDGVPKRGDDLDARPAAPRDARAAGV